MKVADPYANKQGDVRTTIAGTLGELAAHLDEIGRGVRVTLYVSAEQARTEIAPRATGALADALSDAGLGKPSPREARASKPRAPKPAAAPTTRKPRATTSKASKADEAARKASAARDEQIAKLMAQIDALKV